MLNLADVEWTAEDTPTFDRRNCLPAVSPPPALPRRPSRARQWLAVVLVAACIASAVALQWLSQPIATIICR